MAEIGDSFKRWLDGLEEKERNMAELMDAYLTMRSNMPSGGGMKTLADPKTTEDIRDELADMMSVASASPPTLTARCAGRYGGTCELVMSYFSYELRVMSYERLTASILKHS